MPVLLARRALLGAADMTDSPNDPPDTFDMSEDTIMSNEPEKPAQDTPVQPAVPLQNLVHFNPWRDFNDAAPLVDVFGDEPDPDQIEQFMQVVFGYCDGLIPVRSFIDKGQGLDGRPHNIWIEMGEFVSLAQ